MKKVKSKGKVKDGTDFFVKKQRENTLQNIGCYAAVVLPIAAFVAVWIIWSFDVAAFATVAIIGSVVIFFKLCELCE